MSEEQATYEVNPPMTCHMSQEVLKDLIDSAVNAAIEPTHDKLFAALAKAQGEIQAAVADKENTHFNFKYADLDACWEACRKPLSDNELAIVQIPSVGEAGAVTMRTILGHSSGQSISCTYSMHPDKGGPQALGSCMTYLRRYTLCAMVGISQEDDDANMATNDPDEYERISKTQVDELLVLAENLFAKSSDAVVDRMLDKVFQISSVKDIPANLFDEACNLLKNQHTREQKAAKGEKPASKGQATVKPEK
jgi:hypothetical protein